MFQTKFVERIKTRTLFSINFLIENPAVYEIMWADMVEPLRAQVTMHYCGCAWHAG